MDPNRLPREFLESIKNDQEYIHSGQYGQQPSPPGGGLFKVDKFRLDFENAPTPIRWVRSWDKAASIERRSAFTCGVKIGVDEHNRILIADVIRVKLNSFERDVLIKEVAYADGKDVDIIMEQEGGSGGKQSVDISLRSLIGFQLYITRPDKAKEKRAVPYSSQVNGGNVWLVPGPWNKAYISEHRAFPFGSFKDQVDATSQGFTHLVGPSIVTIGPMQEETREELVENRIISPEVSEILDKHTSVKDWMERNTIYREYRILEEFSVPTRYRLKTCPYETLKTFLVHARL